MKFYQLGYFHLLWLAPVLGFSMWMTARWRRRALEQLASTRLLREIVIGVQPSRRRWQNCLFMLGFIFLSLALTRPAWSPKPQTVERWGRDVVFMLDISQSMLAEDMPPNRLARAKLAIEDVLDVLAGDRVALVSFAGTSVVKCPLTLDYGFFAMALNGLVPGQVSRGGTMIGDAIRKALNEVFDESGGRFRDIILITDGEDHDSFPVEAAKEAGNRKIRIIAIGLGDEDEGKRIPVTDERGNKTFLTYQGREVWSKLDADTLRKIVNVSYGGNYFGVATGTIDLDIIYRKLIAEAEQRKVGTLVVKQYEEKFQIFILLAFVFLLAELILELRPDTFKTMFSWKRGGAALILMTLVMGGSVPGWADSAQNAVARGNTLFKQEQYKESLEEYEKADTAGLIPEVHYNAATAHLALDELGEANKRYREAADKCDNPALRQNIQYNLGTVAYREAKRQEDSDLKKAVTSLEESARWFRTVLDSDPEDAEARHNLEVVRLTLKDLIDRQKKQEQEQQGDQQQQQQQQKSDGDEQEQQGDQDQQEAGREEQKQGEEQQQPEGGQDEQDKGEGEKKEEQVAVPEVTPADIVQEEEDRKQDRARRRMKGRPVDKNW